jgi:type IV pilus assembly protein PilO
MTAPKPTVKSLVERGQSWLSPLNLHFAGVGLLVLVNVYLLVHMAFLWQTANSNDAQAQAGQRITLKTSEIAAEPLRGLDAKLARATEEADRFYRLRLPATDSEWAGELGLLTKRHNVRFARGAYLYKPMLAGSAGELTQVQIDASLSGDYKPLIEFINSLERDKMFFVIDSVILTGQQSGTVNLRLRLRTYLRGPVPAGEMQTANADAAAADNAPTPAEVVPGGPGR